MTETTFHKMTPQEFSELLHKVVTARAALQRGRDALWHAEDLSILYADTAEIIGLTMTFLDNDGKLQK